MNSIQNQIHRYIQGNLTEKEIEHLHKNILTKRVWYDYFITEITAYYVFKSETQNLNINKLIRSLNMKSENVDFSIPIPF